MYSDHNSHIAPIVNLLHLSSFHTADHSSYLILSSLCFLCCCSDSLTVYSFCCIRY